MAGTLERLMDAAEGGMRLRGYHAVSFRDLAEDLGIKSSSVHYYFRQKEALGVALVARYSERFFAMLEQRTRNSKSPEGRLRAFCQVYREALVGSDQICLCGMLGAESCGLPEKLADAIAAFFKGNIDWLADAQSGDMSAQDRRERAIHIVSTLQGAMILASSLKDHGVFDSAVSDLLAGSTG